MGFEPTNINDWILSPAPLTRLGNPVNIKISTTPNLFKSKLDGFIKFFELIKTMKSVTEEGIEIKSYGEDITKKLTVFYNPLMKINRDISLLVIASYFNKPIKFCDPMSASGIRELRFLNTIPEKFEKIVMGDISKTAIENIEKNFENNKISLDKVELRCDSAINTISSQFFNFIEIDPFGSPIYFLDSAIQRMKHEGILSVTATDTAALCGTYPKTCARRYGIKVKKTYYYEELGLRNLIAYCQRQGAKYEKTLTPIISMTHNHFYKIFFEVKEGRTKALDTINKLSYLKWDKKTQETTTHKYEDEETFGKTYIGPLNNKDFLNKLLENINLIEDKKEVEKLITKLSEEIDTLGYYDPHKLEKEFKIQKSIKYEKLFEEIEKLGHKISKPHNSRIGIKTTGNHKEIIKVIKDNT